MAGTPRPGDPVGDRRFIVCYLTNPQSPGALLPVDNAEEWVFHAPWRPDSGETLEDFTDEVSSDGQQVRRFNVVVPPNSWVDMQIPRGVSHQFNADGPNAVIDSVHPEESIETLREHMSGYKMMAQTVFLAEQKNPSASCELTSPDYGP